MATDKKKKEKKKLPKKRSAKAPKVAINDDEDEGPPVPTKTQSALKRSLAEKMMQSMAWMEGEGLGKNKQGKLEAKSRLVLPGDVHPDKGKDQDDGGYRTEAPCASQDAVYCFFSVAV